MNKAPTLIAYADGSCLGNPGPGGWGVVLVGNDAAQLEFSGAAASTTNNRMEITAAIEALRRLPSGADLVLRTDSQYLVNTMTRGWKRRENLDLWKILDAEVAQRAVCWEWVRGHSGNPLNERADELARSAALGKSQSIPLGSITQISTSSTSEAPDRLEATGSGSRQEGSQSPEPTLRNEELAEVEAEADIAHALRPLLVGEESLRRCAGCHRAFVATGNPPRMQAYCSAAACQLKMRTSKSNST